MNDDYPSDLDLYRLETWDTNDPRGFIDFAAELWHWHSYVKFGRKYVTFITGGWSGNEDIIHAMMKNQFLWFLLWVSSNRGGKHVLDLWMAKRIGTGSELKANIQFNAKEKG